MPLDITKLQDLVFDDVAPAMKSAPNKLMGVDYAPGNLRGKKQEEVGSDLCGWLRWIEDNHDIKVEYNYRINSDGAFVTITFIHIPTGNSKIFPEEMIMAQLDPGMGVGEKIHSLSRDTTIRMIKKFLQIRKAAGDKV